MQRSALFTVWFITSLVGVQGIIFDIFRNSSTVASRDFCARLHCSVKRENQLTMNIQHIIFLAISKVDTEQTTPVRLAGLSFFEPGVHVYGNPTEVSATGHLVAKDGELKVFLKDLGESCQSGIYVCEIRFINSQNKGEVVKAEKKLVVVKDIAKDEGNSRLDSGTFKYLKTIMTDEVIKIGEQSENLTSYVVSAMQSMSQRLFHLESIISGDLLTRLDALEQKVNKVEMMLSSNVEPKLASFITLLENSTDSLTSLITDKFDVTEEQLSRLEISVEDRISSTENWMNESFKDTSASHIPCKHFQMNMSTILHQVQEQMSTFKAEVMGKLSTAENRLESSNALKSSRFIVETLVRMGHNISETENKLNRLKTDLNTEINTVRLNMSTLNESMHNKHDRFARQVKGNMDNFENKLSSKFVELDQEKQSLTTFGKDVKGKLLNIEINLKDINIVLKNIKYFFGL